MHKYFCFLIFASAFLFGCDNQEDDFSDSGLLVSLSDHVEAALTRGTPSELGTPVASKFNLQVVNTTTGTSTYNGLIPTDGKVKTSPGTYDLQASYGANVELSFDSPYYLGTETGQIVKDGAVTSVNIECSVANALASVEFTNKETLTKLFGDSYGIEIKSANRVLDWNAAQIEAGKNPYFQAGSAVTFTFYATLIADGSRHTLDLGMESQYPIQAATNYKFSITAPDIAGAALDVTLSQESVSISETIPQEWLPAPKAESEDFTAGTLSFTETTSAAACINLKTSSVLDEVKFKLDFQDPAYESLNGEYTLSTLSEQDRTALTSAGIILPELGAKTTVMDFSSMTAGLHALAEASSQNTITFTELTANGRTVSGGTFTLQTEIPDFGPVVLPGDIWTKEFTASSAYVNSGDASVITPAISYEYSADGSTWTDATAGLANGLNPATEYQVRAKFRNHHSTAKTVTTYPQTVLPNGDMEGWTKSEKTQFTVALFKKLTWYFYVPWDSNETDKWWATNNDRAQDWSVAPTYVTTNPCVSYVYDTPSKTGKAAEIRTSGHGGGYASTGEISYPDGAFAGSLFIGTYSWSRDDGDIKSEGHAYGSRPTKLSFKYKYSAYKSDQFKVAIKIQNRTNDIITELASAIYIPTTYTDSASDESYIEYSLPLTWNNENSKSLIPTHIYIEMLSTTKTTFKENEDYQKKSSIDLADATSGREAHVGSRLKIDDIKLIYDK